MRDEKDIDKDIRDVESEIVHYEVLIERTEREARDHMKRYSLAAGNVNDARTKKAHLEQVLAGLVKERAMRRKTLEFAQKTPKAYA
jgi:hypothetical protein